MSCTGVPSELKGGIRQHVGVVEIEHALVGIFGEQRIEHGARLPAIFREHVALPDVLGALAPGQRLPVEGDVADEVERIEVLAQFLGDRIERQALGFQFLDDRLLALRRLPALEEVVEAGEALLQRLLGEVAQGLGDELAVLVEIFDALGDDGGADAIDIDLLLRPAARRQRKAGLIDDRFVGAGRLGQRSALLVGRQRVVGRRDGIAFARLVNLHRLAVEIRVGEMAGGAAEVDQGEIELAGVLVHAGAPADDLLELGHRADLAVEHDQPAGLRIDAGRQQPRGGDEHRIFRFRVDEIAEFGLALGIAAGDAHDVAMVLGDQIGVLVDERLAHSRRVFLIDAEHDGLLEAVAALLQELRDLARDQLGAVVQHQRAVEILGVVDTVLDLLTLAVELTLLRPVALHVAVDMDLHHLVGRQEAVADALLERIGVNRVAEIGDVGDVLGFLRRRGHADLRRRGEIFEDFPPRRILGRAAAVALVDHDQVEEARRELAEQLLPFLRAGDRLIEAEIDFVGGIDPPPGVERGGDIDAGAVVALDGLRLGGELGHRAAERAEVVDHRLVDQHVAVGEVEHALRAARLPQPPDDLKGGVGLAGAGRHDEQHAVAALGDRLDRGVDGVDLIVARGLVAAVGVVILKHDLLGFGVETLPGAIARPQIGRRRKGVEGEIGFPRIAGAGAVVEHEAVAVRGEHEGDVEGRWRSRAPCCIPSPTLWELSLASISASGMLGL